MDSSMKILFLTIILLVAALPAYASTWSVAQDGSGDFQVIQDAVDAAASGDTIRIGPGRYNEGQDITTPGWEEFVRVLISQEELTLIGSGSDVTIIGPTEPFSFSQEGHRGIEAGPFFGNQRIWVSGLGFENMKYGISGAPAPEMTISDCRFERNYGGIFCYNGAGLKVDDCDFNYTAVGDFLLVSHSMDFANISNCNFLLAENGPGILTGVKLDLNFDVNIRGCNFFEGRRGLSISGAVGSYAQIYECSFVGQLVRGLVVVGSSFEVDSCNFHDQRTGLYFYEPTMVASVLNSSFNDINLTSIEFPNVGRLNISNCILEKGERFVIHESDGYCEKGKTYGLPVLYMENCDWGTDNADSIASWIRVCDYEVDFIPFVGGLSHVEFPEPFIQLTAHPNPFNPRTTISFNVDNSQNVELGIFDMMGKRIAILADRLFEAGVHSLNWQGKDQQGHAVSSGTYLIRLSNDSGVTSQKVMLVR